MSESDFRRTHAVYGDIRNIMAPLHVVANVNHISQLIALREEIQMKVTEVGLK